MPSNDPPLLASNHLIVLRAVRPASACKHPTSAELQCEGVISWILVRAMAIGPWIATGDDPPIAAGGRGELQCKHRQIWEWKVMGRSARIAA